MDTATVEVDVSIFDDVPACGQCGVAHQPDMPHAMTGRYELQFQRAHGRMPTFEDTIAHCGPDIKRAWEDALRQQVYYRCFAATLKVAHGKTTKDNQGNKLHDITDLIIADAEGRWP